MAHFLSFDVIMLIYDLLFRLLISYSETSCKNTTSFRINISSIFYTFFYSFK